MTAFGKLLPAGLDEPAAASERGMEGGNTLAPANRCCTTSASRAIRGNVHLLHLSSLLHGIGHGSHRQTAQAETLTLTDQHLSHLASCRCLGG